MELGRVLRRKIVVLDGAMGTELIARGNKGVLELLNVDAPAEVEQVHEAYLRAGADIITTNTTCADSLCLKEHGLQERSYELARAGAEVARRVADRFSTTETPRFVAGSVGPTSRNVTLANDTSADEVAQSYATVIQGLIDGGVDMLLIETAMDSQNVKIAVEQARKLSPTMPIIVSAVLSRIEGRVASGATIKQFLEDIPTAELFAVGFNCTMATKHLEKALKSVAEFSKLPLVVYPSLSAVGESAAQFVKPLDLLARAGLLNIVGGCCGTTPAHIEHLSKAVARWRPRKTE